MTMLLDYGKVWINGGYAKDNPLENTIAFVMKEADRIHADKEIVSTVIHEVMLEAAMGRQFPLKYCPCGCGIDKSGTAITHEMIKRLRELTKEVKLNQVKILEEKINIAVLGHISEQNKQYIKENKRFFRASPIYYLFRWDFSPTLKLLKKLWIFLQYQQLEVTQPQHLP